MSAIQPKRMLRSIFDRAESSASLAQKVRDRIVSARAARDLSRA